jgi:copper chaperone CopZ
METVTLTAPDIGCEHCKRTIERELGELAGITSCRVNIPTQRVDVTYDSTRISRDAIVARLDDEGYPVAS